MKTTSIALSLAVASMVLPACGNKKKSKKNTTAPAVIFVHGNPQQLIAGSTQDKKSFLTTENFKTFNGFHFAGGGFFIEKEKQVNPKDFSEVEEDNKTTDDDEGSELVRYSFVEEGGRVVYRPENSKIDYPSFSFKVNNGVLELSDVDGNSLAIEHYSLKQDGKAFSILGSFSNSTQGRGLITLTFADSAEVNALTASPEDKNFNFLNGHSPVKWEGPISLDLCGVVPQQQQDSIRLSLEAWYADPLRQAGEEFKGVSYSVKTQFPPFSDLNSHCVFIVNQFKAENSTNFFVGGMNLPGINFASKELIDTRVGRF